MIRPLHVGDLARLFWMSGRLSGNQAAPRDAVFTRRGKNLRWVLLRRWFSPGDTMRGWVCMEEGQFRGVVSAHDRSSPLAWEVDLLLFGSLSYECASSLLEALSNAAAEQGVLKVFLRLPQDSPVIKVAMQAEFCPYGEEKLYRAKGPSFPRAKPIYDFQSWSEEQDAQNLFHLYCQNVPATVRSAEGMTFEEWKVSREPAVGRSQQFSCYQENEFVGWVRASKFGRKGNVELLARPAHREDLLAFGMGRLHRRSSIVCLVPSFQTDLAAILERHKFEPRGNFTTLMKQTTSRVREPQLAPLRA